MMCCLIHFNINEDGMESLPFLNSYNIFFVPLKLSIWSLTAHLQHGNPPSHLMLRKVSMLIYDH